MIPAGRLSSLITLEARNITDDPRLQSWTYERRVWAEKEQTSETTAIFRIHFRRGVGPGTHRIVHDGAIWNITHSYPMSAVQSMLVLESDFSNLVEATHAESHEKEFIDNIPIVKRPTET